MGKARVMLIDDEVGFTDGLKINLEVTGQYEVAVVNDSMKALDSAAEFEPDVVVLDIVMPGKDGGDVAGEFANHPKLKDVPIIMLTALVSNEETADNTVVETGGQVMVAKPVKTGRLIEVIEKKLRGKI